MWKRSLSILKEKKAKLLGRDGLKKLPCDSKCVPSLENKKNFYMSIKKNGKVLLDEKKYSCIMYLIHKI